MMKTPIRPSSSSLPPLSLSTREIVHRRVLLSVKKGRCSSEAGEGEGERTRRARIQGGKADQILSARPFPPFASQRPCCSARGTRSATDSRDSRRSRRAPAARAANLRETETEAKKTRAMAFHVCCALTNARSATLQRFPRELSAVKTPRRACSVPSPASRAAATKRRRLFLRPDINNSGV